MEKALATTTDNREVSIFQTGGDFSKALQMAKVMSSSTMVPSQYQGDRNVPNVIVAMELAHRIGISPFMVMQNLHVIQGRPSWASPFLIAMIEQSGRFDPLRFDVSGTGDGRGCVAWTTLKMTGERLEGPRVDIAMAKNEGWYGRNGSKWKTMPDVMLRYRSAAFFARLYAYDLVCGLQTMDEVIDVDPRDVRQETSSSLATELLAESATSVPSPASEPSSNPEVVDAEFGESEAKREEESDAIPSMQTKGALWNRYLKLLGNRNHAINAIKKITEGRGSDDWTMRDIEALNKDLERRAEEETAKAQASAPKAQASAPKEPDFGGADFDFDAPVSVSEESQEKHENHETRDTADVTF